MSGTLTLFDLPAPAASPSPKPARLNRSAPPAYVPEGSVAVVFTPEQMAQLREAIAAEPQDGPVEASWILDGLADRKPAAPPEGYVDITIAVTHEELAALSARAAERRHAYALRGSMLGWYAEDEAYQMLQDRLAVVDCPIRPEGRR